MPDQYDERLYFETKSFLTNHVKKLVKDVEHKTGLVLLKSYYEAWTQYSQSMVDLDELYE